MKEQIFELHRRLGLPKPVRVLKRTRLNMQLTSFQSRKNDSTIKLESSGGAGDDGDLEVVTFVFTEYQEEYKPQNGDGTGGAAVTAGFNCIKCVKF